MTPINYSFSTIIGTFTGACNLTYLNTESTQTNSELLVYRIYNTYRMIMKRKNNKPKPTPHALRFTYSLPTNTLSIHIIPMLDYCYGAILHTTGISYDVTALRWYYCNVGDYLAQSSLGAITS